MQRVARLARAELGDLFGVYKYALLGLGGGATYSSKDLKFACNDLYMPETAHAVHLEHALKLRDIPSYQYIRPKGHFQWKHSFQAGVEIILSPFNALIEDWSMDFRTDGRFSGNDKFTSPHDAPTHFREAVKKVYAGDPDLELNCEQLKAESAKRVSEFESSGKLKAAIEASRVQLQQQTLGCLFSVVSVATSITRTGGRRRTFHLIFAAKTASFGK